MGKELDDAASQAACCYPGKYDFAQSVTESFHDFKPLTDEDVRSLVKKSSKKSCAHDPMLTTLVTVCIDVLLSVFKRVINANFPNAWKEALVNPP